MNYHLLADEIRGLAEGDVDSEIALADMTDEQIVQHVASCPCCDEPLVEGDHLNQLVTESTNLEEFIMRVNSTQKGYELTEEEYGIVEDIITNGINTAVAVVLNLRKVSPTDQGVVDDIAQQVWAVKDALDISDQYDCC